MATTTVDTTAARIYEHDHDTVSARVDALMNDPDLTFHVLMQAVTATPALTTFAGNRPQALMYLRLTASEVTLAWALAAYGLTPTEVMRAASGEDRYCLDWVPTSGGKDQCWHRLTDSGACPNDGEHA